MKRAWIFPGQGSQYIGMGKNFFEQFDLVKNYFERASQVLSFDLAKLCLTGQEEELKLTFNAQPAILTLSVALAELLIEKGVPRPQIIAGHSLGEFSALVFKGNLQFEDAIAIVHERGLAMQEAVPKGEGGMLALVGGNFDQVKEMLKHLPKGAILEVANDNGGGQIIVSGNLAGNDWCKNEAKNHGIRRAMPLPVSAPFHSSLMKAARDRLEKTLKGKIKNATERTSIEVIHNFTASSLDESKIENALLDQLTGRVRWRETLDYLKGNDISEFLEVGPKNILSGLVKRHLKEIPSLPIENWENFKNLTRS